MVSPHRSLHRSPHPSRRALPRTLAATLALTTAAASQAWLDAARECIPFGDGVMRDAADFDGDGRLDLLVTRTPTTRLGIDRLRILLGQPDGSFAPGPDLPRQTLGFEAEFFALAGDLTGDGRPDVITSLRGLTGGPGAGFVLYVNLGGNSFAPGVRAITDEIPWGDATLSDWNGDGVRELVAMSLSPIGAYATLRRWTWQGNAFVASAAYRTPTWFDQVALADLDGDGLQDTVFGGPDAPQIFVLPTLPNGDFGAADVYTVGTPTGSSGRGPATGDVDGDGDQDIVVAWRSGSSGAAIAVLENDGTGQLTAGPTTELPVQPGGFWAGRAHVADWDRDGDGDIVIGFEFLLRIENRGADGFELVDVLRIARPRPNSGSLLDVDGGESLGVLDVDGDGHADFLGGRAMYRGDGLLRPQSFGATLDSDLRDVDFDDDGAIDLLDPRGTLHRQQSAGRFTALPLLPDLSSPLRYGLVHGFDDFDGDGERDLLVTVFDVSQVFPQFLEMRLLVGTGVGGFVDRGAAAAPLLRVGDTNTLLYEQRDLDGDGDIDLAATNGWWPNDGTGRFTTRRDDWVGAPLQVVDVDGDGRADVLTLFQSTASRHELHRNTPGGFVTEVLASFEDRAAATRGQLVDLDDDGDLDFVCGTSVGPAIQLRENRGGSFAPTVTLMSRDIAFQRIVVDDFDGDGRADLAAFPVAGGTSGLTGSGGTALVWPRVGSGLAYGSPRAFLAPEPIYGSADLDGDGDRDPRGRTRAVDNQRHRGASAGSFDRYGDDQAGPSGIAPILGVAGPVRAGGTLELRVRRARGSAPAFLVLGTTPAAIRDVPFPGLTLYVSPVDLAVPVPLGGAAGGIGAGTLDLPIAVPTALNGVSLFLQVFALDGTAMSATGGLRLAFGG